jgi:DNA polymerase III sliding clamp (beta) subunit (PCNA family)
MEINRKKFQEALAIVKPGLANKEFIEQTTSFAFMGNTVVTYNDEISVSHPVDGLDLTGALQAKELYELLGRMKGETIELTVKDGELQLKSGKVKAGFTLEEEIKLPLDQDIAEQGTWYPVPEGFCEAMKIATASCGWSASQGKWTAIHVEGNTVESGDGFRYTRCTLADVVPIKAFLIPAESAPEALRIKPTQMAEGDGWVHFRNEADTVLSCRVFYEEDYPDITPVFDVTGQPFHFPMEITDLLERATLFAKRDALTDERVYFTLAKGRMIIKSDSVQGWFREDMPIEYTDEPRHFSMYPYSIQDVIQRENECVLGESMLLIKGKTWVYVAPLLAIANE